MATSISGTSITVSWDPVPCLSRNSEITGYVVRYNEVSNSCHVDTEVSASETSVTLEGLTGSTQYSIQVAAVSASGTGPFSGAVTAETTAAAATTAGEWTESGMH